MNSQVVLTTGPHSNKVALMAKSFGGRESKSMARERSSTGCWLGKMPPVVSKEKSTAVAVLAKS